MHDLMFYPRVKGQWFINNISCHLLSRARQGVCFSSLAVKNFLMSSVFDKITSSCSYGSGSDESPFYSAVKNTYAWRIILKVSRGLEKPKHAGRYKRHFRSSAINQYLNTLAPAFFSEIAFMILYLKSAILFSILLYINSMVGVWIWILLFHLIPFPR